MTFDKPMWFDWMMVYLAAQNFVISGSPLAFFMALALPWVLLYRPKNAPHRA